MGSWWSELYDDLLADAFLDRGPRAETVAFLRDQLRLQPRQTVFDQCCGTGGIALPLARAGYRVIGVDQAARYIERGRRRAAAEQLDVELHVGDAFEFAATPPCDAGINWWTSFGYLDDDDGNARMLRRASESVVAGGRFALDFMNAHGVLGHFEARTETRHDTAAGEVVLVRDSWYDPGARVIEKVWTYGLPDGGRVRHESRVRLYQPDELEDLLRACGFVDVERFGSVRGESLGLDSPRCICIATRP